MTPNSSLEAYIAVMEEIHGGFHHPDPYVFAAVSAAQTEHGISGDLLEIGTYRGRSAIVLGYLLGEEETLHVCEPFPLPSADNPDFLPHTIDWYEPYTQQIFEENYLRFHDELPEIYPFTSLELRGKLKPDSFRFLHLDGSHTPEVLESDIALAKDLLIDDGVMSFSAFRSAHTLEVAAAAWKEVAEGAVFPICATGTHLYASVKPYTAERQAELHQRLSRVPNIVATPSRLKGSQITLMQAARAGSRSTTLRSFVPPVLLPAARRARSWLRGLRSG